MIDRWVQVGQLLLLESILHDWIHAGGYIYSGGRLVDVPAEITFQSLHCLEVFPAGSHLGTLVVYSEHIG
jgi:hypothetical protein